MGARLSIHTQLRLRGQSSIQEALGLALACATAVAATVDRRMPEAVALAVWLDARRTTLGMGPGADFADGSISRPAVSAASWRRLRDTLRRAETAAARVPPGITDTWLQVLCDRLGINGLGRSILALALAYHTDDRFEALLDGISDARGSGRRLTCDPHLLALMLGAPSHEVEAALAAYAPLRESGLLAIENDCGLQVAERLQKLVGARVSPGTDPLVQIIGPTTPATLGWEDFAHLGPTRDIAARVLAAAVQGRETGVNLLLYGPPGTGKTTFAAVLAARVGAQLRAVAEQDDDSAEPTRTERMQGLRLAQRLSPHGESVLLFDEAEDLFTPRPDPHGAGGSRVFIHRLLEQLRLPVIWTANDIGAFGPAVLRRMTLCLEIKVPAAPVRRALWRSLAANEGIALDEADAARLTRLVPAAPAMAATALRATRLAQGDAQTACTIVEGIARAVAGGHLPAPPAAPDDRYDPALVNADCDLPVLLDRLARPGAPRAISLLLSGPPGTGKSQLARHIADRMGLEVMHRRASDLLDPYVGMTERRIAEAFAQARGDGAFLVFDEADSLLADRTSARHGWEVSQVNEMLTWMEHHPLPFACTTNLPDRLDPASLRRFLVKLRLGALTTAQARLAWTLFFGSAPPLGLDRLSTLTPADFALVVRRVAVMDGADDVRRLALLADECGARRPAAGAIGFRPQGAA